jgi:hypothetical protein
MAGISRADLYWSAVGASEDLSEAGVSAKRRAVSSAKLNCVAGAARVAAKVVIPSSEAADAGTGAGEFTASSILSADNFFNASL